MSWTSSRQVSPQDVIDELKSIADWLNEHQDYMDWQVNDGYQSIIDSLGAMADRIQEYGISRDQ